MKKTTQFTSITVQWTRQLLVLPARPTVYLGQLSTTAELPSNLEYNPPPWEITLCVRCIPDILMRKLNLVKQP